MPTYQYACTACGHQLEAVQSFADDPLTECPACEGRLRKLFSAVGIVFKGSGFYRNDSRSNNGSAGDRSADKVGAGAAKSGGDTAGGDRAGGDRADSAGRSADGPRSGDAGTSGGKAAGAGTVKDSSPKSTSAKAA